MTSATTTIRNAENAIDLGNQMIGDSSRWKTHSVCKNLSWTVFVIGIGAVAALVAAVALAIFGQFPLAIVFGALFAVHCIGIYSGVKSSLNTPLTSLVERFTMIINKLHQKPKEVQPIATPQPSILIVQDPHLADELATTKLELEAEKQELLSVKDQLNVATLELALLKATSSGKSSTPPVVVPPVTTPTLTSTAPAKTTTNKTLKPSSRRTSLPAPHHSTNKGNTLKVLTSLEKVVVKTVKEHSPPTPKDAVSALPGITASMNQTTADIEKITAILTKTTAPAAAPPAKK